MNDPTRGRTGTIYLSVATLEPIEAGVKFGNKVSIPGRGSKWGEIWLAPIP